MRGAFCKSRMNGLGAALLMSGLLAGCGSSPPANITLPVGGSAPPPAAAFTTAAAPAPAPVQPGDVRTRSVSSEQSRPGCRGKNCPAITIDSVAFPDLPRLTTAVDQRLSRMTGVDENLSGVYHNLSGYAAYFWHTAQDGDHTWVKARLRGVVGDVISVELDSNQQVIGASHPIPATRFLLWRRSTDSEIDGLDDVLIEGRHAQYVAALRTAYAQWLQNSPAYREHPADYDKLWPFVESDNVALTEQGLVVKYDAYTIAPYSSGQPEIVLPWSVARTLVRPEFLPH